MNDDVNVEIAEMVEKVILAEDVKMLCKWHFDFSPTPGQENIIREIAFQKHKRLIINCMTQYGKTKSVAIAVGLFIGMERDKKILLIGPTYNQTNILRNYMAELIADSELLSEMVIGKVAGAQRLKKQLSKSRITFSNGCELSILSGEGDAKRLVGFGGDLIIIDESCLIKPEVFRSKISRMLGNNPNAMLVELSNPWTRDSHYFEHWTSPRFHKIHIGWRQAVEEGRVTNDFIQEQLSTLTPSEFAILYESQFPNTSEDALFDFIKVEKAYTRKLDVKPNRRVLGCDPADKGKDKTVIFPAWNDDNLWKFFDPFSEAKSEQTALGGRLIAQAESFRATDVNVDYGMGAGILSMVREGVVNRKTRITACYFGAAPYDKKRFLNRKAEMYFYAMEVFNSEEIEIPRHETLIKELLSIKWRRTSGGKIQIIDPPDKSPDFADALIITMWRQKSGTYAIA